MNMNFDHRSTNPSLSPSDLLSEEELVDDFKEEDGTNLLFHNLEEGSGHDFDANIADMILSNNELTVDTDTTSRNETVDVSIDELLAKDLNQMSIEERELFTENLTKIDPEAGEKLLAKNLIQMPVADREDGLYDLHGVSDSIEETEELVTKSLKDFDSEIDKIEPKDGYLQAKALSPEYVQDDSFRLMFLRSDRFVARNAAARMVRFFDEKLKIFGPSYLLKEIRIQDLGKKEQQVLESGYLQVLNGRDRAGRALLFCDLSLRQFGGDVAEIVMQRVFYYLLASIAQDEESQKRGITMICLNIRPTQKIDKSRALQYAYLTKVVPLRVGGIHICVNQPFQRFLASIITLLMGISLSLRTRTHYGSVSELTFSLGTFGIDSKLLPIDSDGEPVMTSHMQWLEQRKQLESASDGDRRIMLPGPYDVLVGRGKFIQDHPGNFRYRHVIENHMLRYEQSSKRVEKTNLTSEIVQVVKGYGGRFLKQENGGWIEIDDESARDKVSHSFRNLRQSMGASSTKSACAKKVSIERSTGQNRDSKKVRMTPSPRFD